MTFEELRDSGEPYVPWSKLEVAGIAIKEVKVEGEYAGFAFTGYPIEVAAGDLDACERTATIAIRAYHGRQGK